MRPYDIECIVLGTVLKYGNEPARTVLPQLTSDKFVFNTNGEFGSAHSEIWGAITDLTLADKKTPSFANVAVKLGQYHTELKSLVDRLENQYRIYVFDSKDFIDMAERVDKQGVVYNMSRIGGKLYAAANDVETFFHTSQNIDDIERWASDRLSEFRQVVSTQSSGYVHISTIVESVKEKWERQYRGEELILPDNGFPSLMSNVLFPVRKMAVIHGLSSSGKSTLVFQVLLGTAIGLYVNNVKGCVAINSLEMEQEDLVERMVSILAHTDITGFARGAIREDDLNNLFTWADFVSNLPIYVDDTNFITTSAMEYRASGLHVSEHGPVIQLASDYGELFRDDNKSEEQRVNKIFREQFRLSREIGCSMIAISQSTTNKAESGKTYIAGPDGTRYSRGILQAADILGELWNPVQMEAAGRTVIAPDGFSTSHPWLFIQKYRGGKAGIAIPLGWRPETTTFFDMSIDQAPGKETIFTHLHQALDKMHIESPIEAAW